MIKFAAFLFLFAPVLRPQDARTVFRIKYVADGAVYLDGGKLAGLAEKMKLTSGNVELEVVSVAASSAVCEIRTPGAELHPGDTAQLSAEDAQASQLVRAAGSGSHYAQTITFTEGDPVDEEVRDYTPRPKLPEVNRVRGRIGVEYGSIFGQGAGLGSNQASLVLRADMTRINGSYWNLSGYTRLRFTAVGTGQQQTLNDLMNRTYHLVLTYNNPQSKWVMGFGRFYLPWAPSLSTIDGGYVARRISRTVTAGVFAGTTPDPTSWNYSPNREMAGAFVNLQGGSYDGLHYSSTEGLGLSRLNWRPEREFAFLENDFSWQRRFSVYHSMEIDASHPTTEKPQATGTGIARSFLTVRYEASKWLSLDVNHNYFRDFPTFDPRLAGTGLLDKLLFQGVSGGARANLPWRRASVYFNIGRSNGNNDPKASWNQMFGAALSDVLGTGVRADGHYARFNSSFGQGHYTALTATRDMWEGVRLQVQAGQQDFTSAVTASTRARFVNGNLDWVFARHYFAGIGTTFYRSQTQSYNQIFLSLGYRF